MSRLDAIINEAMNFGWPRDNQACRDMAALMLVELQKARTKLDTLESRIRQNYSRGIDTDVLDDLRDILESEP